LNDTDDALIARCRRGDQQAWTALVSRHARRVFGLGYHVLRNAADAEDLVQEVFVKVLQGLQDTAVREGGFSAWVMAIARHHAVDVYRHRRLELQHRDHEPLALAQAVALEPPPDALVHEQERARLLRAGLRALPADLREAVTLRDVNGLDYEQIADATGLPLGTVKSRINRGRLELARRMGARVAAAR
jgi:RNA polymerase sigma-70 factor (ECF subfamily)